MKNNIVSLGIDPYLDSIDLPKFDLVLSQAIMEQVDHPETIYQNIAKNVRFGGLLSKQVDLKSHGLSYEWDGHWRYS